MSISRICTKLIMADNTHLLALEAFLAQQPSIKYFPPSSPDFDSLRQVWSASVAGTSLAVVQPQSALDVASLIKFVKAKSVPFTLRSGGHNLEGRAAVDDALQIDLRALNTVAVAPDRKSATVGGGILQGELGKKLWEEGLATPTGSIPSVGYTGWATYGGYGSFSSHWGLGVNQILGATIVNADGEIQAAGQELLEGIRGAGGLFGVIVDLTIKVYPLTGVSPLRVLDNDIYGASY
jgi:FAD/FMN-containing dehydrogenase